MLSQLKAEKEALKNMKSVNKKQLELSDAPKKIRIEKKISSKI